MILGVTGHRPYSIPGVTQQTDREWIERRLDMLAEVAIRQFPFGRADRAISGMAEGWDTACAEVCLRLGIPLVAAVPFEGQERYWSGRAQARYRAILAQADQVEIVSETPARYGGGLARLAYFKRDEWIVDHADAMLGFCGKEEGGSAYTLRYADRWCVPSYNTWVDWIGLNQ